MALRLSCFYLMQVHVAWYIIVFLNLFQELYAVDFLVLTLNYI